jgi:hypothetical protein
MYELLYMCIHFQSMVLQYFFQESKLFFNSKKYLDLLRGLFHCSIETFYFYVYPLP